MSRVTRPANQKALDSWLTAKFESQTHPQDDHVDRITYCSTRYGQAHVRETGQEKMG